MARRCQLKQYIPQKPVTVGFILQIIRPRQTPSTDIAQMECAGRMDTEIDTRIIPQSHCLCIQ